MPGEKVSPESIAAKRVLERDALMLKGHKAGFCILWKDYYQLDDPLHWVLRVKFNLSDYMSGTPAYLQMMTHHVQFEFNDVYVNGERVASLTPSGQKGWWFESIVIPNLRQGTNELLVITRNNTGGQSGNLDMFRLRDAVLFYAAE